jgi:alpha-ketoglutarate-dependent taurine dioxygenase
VNYQTMDVRPIAGALGAEIYGADLKDRDDSPLWQELRQAFLEYKVIAVRGQDMSPADLMRVGGKFGEPARYPFAKGMDGFPLVTRIVGEFRQSYVCVYRPAGVPLDGWHDLEVSLPGRSGVTIRARRGYFGR